MNDEMIKYKKSWRWTSETCS